MMRYSDIRKLHESAGKFALGPAAVARIEKELLPDTDPTMGGYTEVVAVARCGYCDDDAGERDHTVMVIANGTGRTISYYLYDTGGLSMRPQPRGR